MMRLDRFLSEAGLASRKELKQIIRSGSVRVDGLVAKNADMKIDENHAEVLVDGQRIRLKGRTVLLLHKPAGYVTSTEDPRDRTVMELLPEEYRNLFPVGRLDKETEGLLLFTDDGDLCHRLISPKSGTEKEYLALTEGQPDEEDAAAFRGGIVLRDGTECLPAELIPLAGGCRVILHEGKYHQVRRMLASRGKPVKYLRRIREGSLTIEGLERGEYRLLTEKEINEML